MKINKTGQGYIKMGRKKLSEARGGLYKKVMFEQIPEFSERGTN